MKIALCYRENQGIKIPVFLIRQDDTEIQLDAVYNDKHDEFYVYLSQSSVGIATKRNVRTIGHDDIKSVKDDFVLIDLMRAYFIDALLKYNRLYDEGKIDNYMPKVKFSLDDLSKLCDNETTEEFYIFAELVTKYMEFNGGNMVELAYENYYELHKVKNAVDITDNDFKEI